MKLLRDKTVSILLMSVLIQSSGMSAGVREDTGSQGKSLYSSDTGTVPSAPFLEWLTDTCPSFGGSLKFMRKLDEVRLLEIETCYQIKYEYEATEFYKPIIYDDRTLWERHCDNEAVKTPLIIDGSRIADVAGIAYKKGLYYGDKRPIVWVIDGKFQMITGYRKSYWMKDRNIRGGRTDAEAYLGKPEDISGWNNILLPDSMDKVRRVTLSEDAGILHEWFHPDAEIFGMNPVILYLELSSKPSYDYAWWQQRKSRYKLFGDRRKKVKKG
ncbi:MAG: hypothetical protein J6C86_10530 [Bacteroidaceae bacterium]|nr:hypothetical protein [Bacteroidaceae bacterium]